MPTDAKRQAVSQLADMLRESSALAVADYRGLTVSEMHTVRRSLRASGVSFKVAKNRLLKIAADEAGLEELKPLLSGPTALAIGRGDEIGLARALQDAFRPYKVVTLRGGLLAGQPISAADLQRLATLPGREVLLARLAGGMAAPLAGMAGVLGANLRNLVGVLSAVADRKRATEGTAAASPADAGTAPAEAPEAPEAPEAAGDAGSTNDVQVETDSAETEGSDEDSNVEDSDAEDSNSAEGPDATEEPDSIEDPEPTTE